MINSNRLQAMAIVAILFILIGYMAPIFYVGVAPDSSFVEVERFDAADTYVGADYHEVCFDRTVHKPADADLTVELRLLKEDGTLVEADSFKIDAFYQEGSEDVRIQRNLEDSEQLQPGTYSYLHAVELSYYDDRAAKEFTFVSDKFEIHESEEALEQANNTDCYE